MTTDTAHAGTIMHVDLAALQNNYRKLAQMSLPAECGAAIKANAYGLGMEQCATALWAAGCRIFFVALVDEAIDLRKTLPDAVIYILNGLMPGTAGITAEANARPSLSSFDEIAEWAELCTSRGTRLPAAIHIETGMNRVGLTVSDIDTLHTHPDLLDQFELTLIVSHLANGEIPGDLMNARQLEQFNHLRSLLPNAPASIANSPGIFNGSAFGFDLTRPGIALYGGNPGAENSKNPMQPVVRLLGTISQVRTVPKGETIGYGGTWQAKQDSKIAVVSAGYADGYPRALSSMPDLPDTRVWIDGFFAPVIGRISMDMITVDVTAIPVEIGHRGDHVELLGPHVTIDEIAARAGTISYEILTGLGSRATRMYSCDHIKSED